MSSLNQTIDLKDLNEKRSLSSLMKEDYEDISQSSISQNSNDKVFSIKDIWPDSSFLSESKHQRMNSGQIDILSPQYLFSHTRKNSKQTTKRKQLSMNGELELNSTRMHTYQSRKVSECEMQALQIPESSSICMENSKEFCKNCQKDVDVVLAFSDHHKVESVFLEFLDYFFVCCYPDWLRGLKTKTCRSCGSAI